jgi:uncharacterized membrane protein YfcA
VTILLFMLIGVGAQIVDGTLGMAFGVVSSTILVLTGTAPAAAAASVHLAEMGTTVSSGVAHWREGNVDKKLLINIGIPGGVGAFFGAYVLAGVDLSRAKPLTNGILLCLGFYLLYKSWRISEKRVVKNRGRGFYTLLGGFSGFIDAAGGGGWGPVATPTLLIDGREPRKVVGTVSAAEFIVASSASIGYLTGSAGRVSSEIVIGLLIGGAVVAPVAAKISRRLDPRKFMKLIAMCVIYTNTYGLLKTIKTLDVQTQLIAPLLVLVGFYYITKMISDNLKDGTKKSGGFLSENLSQDEGQAETREALAGEPSGTGE